jgi:hypothetical protein
LLERLAVLMPRPRINLLLYYGVLAPHAAWRAEVVPGAGAAVDASGAAVEIQAASPPSPGGRRWAALMRRAFEVDVLACPRCGGPLRLLALLGAGAVNGADPAPPGAADRGPAGTPGAGAPARERLRVLVTGEAVVGPDRMNRRTLATGRARPCAGLPEACPRHLGAAGHRPRRLPTRRCRSTSALWRRGRNAPRRSDNGPSVDHRPVYRDYRLLTRDQESVVMDAAVFADASMANESSSEPQNYW